MENCKKRKNHNQISYQNADLQTLISRSLLVIVKIQKWRQKQKPKWTFIYFTDSNRIHISLLRTSFLSNAPNCFPRLPLLKGVYSELSHVNMLFFSFQGYSDIRDIPFFKKMEILIFDTHRLLSDKISPFEFTQRHSSEGCLFTSEKACDVECQKPKRSKFLWKAILWK